MTNWTEDSRHVRIRRNANRLSIRLASIALLPALGLLGFGGLTSVNRWHKSEVAAQGSADVALLNNLMQLQLSVLLEEHPSSIEIQASELHIGIATAQKLVGFSLSERIGGTRQATDTFAKLVSAELDVSSNLRLLSHIRDQVDASNIDASTLRAEYATLNAALASATSKQLAQTRTTVGAIRGSATLDVGLLNLVAGYRLVDVAARELPLVLNGYLGEQTTASSQEAATELTKLWGWYQIAGQEMNDSLTGDARIAWVELHKDPQVRRFEDAIDNAQSLRTVAVEHDNVSVLASLAGDGFVRASKHLAVFTAISESIRREVDRVKTQAREDFAHSTMYIAFFLIATLIILLSVARSVLRPLRNLARVAVRVSHGDLPSGGRPLTGGPHEVRVVGGAFDQLIKSLRVFDAQALALAQGRLDDPELQTELPGRLASSIHQTVQQLSQSMTDRDSLHARLVHEATHDSLTGIPNRAAAMFALETMAIRHKDPGTLGALLFVDLDGFKRANDAHGHHIGDEVLVETARRLGAFALRDGFVARLGGDEFVLICYGASLKEIVQLGQSVIARIKEPMDIRGRVVRIGASVGVAITQGNDEATSADLLRSADLAVYRAKELGRNRVEVFDEAMRREVAKRMEVEAALSAALDRSELHYALQPVWSLAKGQICGFEALVRWDRTDGSTLTPDEFIPVAESSGLIDAVDNFVLLQASKEIASWSEFTCADVYLAVNISGRHLLSRTVVDDVRTALEHSGLDPQRLVVEITETVLVADMVTACEHLDAIRRMGVRVAIDDFGSGYTSLGHLRILPVDILKIDRAFVTALGSDSDDRLVRVLIEAAQGLGLSVVAEGVETMSQLHVLRNMTCDSVQGHLLGKAVLPTEARDQLRLNRSEGAVSSSVSSSVSSAVSSRAN